MRILSTMKKLITILFGLFLFGGFSSATFAFSCDNITITGKSTKNEALESFLPEKGQLFFQEASKLKILDNCDKTAIDAVAKTIKEARKEAFFGVDNFLFSFSAFYNNSCQQQDTEKILELIDMFEESIFKNLYNCKDISKLETIKNDTIAMLKFIRDHDDFLASQKTSENGLPFSSYWNEDLYKVGSTLCPVESWQEVGKAWCKLQSNVQNFSNIGNTFSKDAIDYQALSEAGAIEARKYISINLPAFLELETIKASSSKRWEIKSLFEKIFAPIINTFNETIYGENSAGKNTQDILVMKDIETKNTIKLLESQQLLTNISNTYGKSYKAQLYLEKEIKLFSDHVAKTTEKNSQGYNLHKFLTVLQKTEKQSSQCSVSIP